MECRPPDLPRARRSAGPPARRQCYGRRQTTDDDDRRRPTPESKTILALYAMCRGPVISSPNICHCKLLPDSNVTNSSRLNSLQQYICSVARTIIIIINSFIQAMLLEFSIHRVCCSWFKLDKLGSNLLDLCFAKKYDILVP